MFESADRGELTVLLVMASAGARVPVARHLQVGP